MCAITGVLTFGRPSQKFQEDLAALLHASEQRGRDGFGFITSPMPHCVKILPPSRPTLVTYMNAAGFFNAHNVNVLLANHRAEPTTEYVAVKTAADQQPYEYDGWLCVHNGTIANDLEILRRHRVVRAPTNVDSYSLAVAQAHDGMEDVKGSVAALFWHTTRNEMRAVRNWNPLTVMWVPDEKTFVFSSLLNASRFITGAVVLQFPPYSTGTDFKSDGTFLRKTTTPGNQHRGVVVCSGGMDSVVAATIAREQCQDLKLLYFCYGCPAEDAEMVAVSHLADHLKCEVALVNMKWLYDIGGSPLTEPGGKISGAAGAEFAYEWVPARNTAMVGAAAAYCDRHDVGRMYLGFNLEESGAYPDNTEEFINRFSQVLDVGTRARPKIVCPLKSMTKKEIVAEGLARGAPLHLAWSCYRGHAYHCGRCASCYMRRRAFSMLGAQDNVKYESDL